MPVRLPLIKYDSTVWSDCYEFRKFAPSRTGGVTADFCALPGLACMKRETEKGW